MSSNPLNDISKVYLDQVANVKKAETQADIQRWEEIGGPTPDNYKPTGNSAKIRTESVSKSDWRNDIFEAGDPDAVQTPGYKTSKDSSKRVTEKSGVNNTVVINPKLNEAIKEIGGEVLEVVGENTAREQQLQKKQLMLDRLKLQMRRKAMSQQKKETNQDKEGTNTEAQANVVANEGVMTMIGKKKPEKKAEKAMDAGARAKRMLARKIHAKYVSGSTENVPDDIAEAKVDKGRSDYGKASIRNYRRMGPGHDDPAMFDSSNKRGKTIDKRREEHKARRGVKGAKVPAYKVSEESGGEKVDGKFMSYATMKAKGIKPKKTALQSVKDKYKGQIYDPKKDRKPSKVDQVKAASERKKRQDADNKAYAARAKKAGFKSTQDYTNVVARYGGEDNYKKGRGLGT